MKNMSSREIMTAALKGEDLPFIPCSIYFNRSLRVPEYDLSTHEGRIKCYLDLGTEPVLDIPLPGPVPCKEVETKIWIEDKRGEEHPVLFKEYETPEGTLRQGVRYTPDWPFGMDIPFPGNDHCASNNCEPLIKSPEDIKAFAYLWGKPDEEEIEKVKKQVRPLLELADKYEIATRTTVGQGLATSMFCMGAQNMVLFAMDYPDAFKEMASFEHRMTIDRIKTARIFGIDILKRFGGYEQTNFFSPSIFKDVVMPLAKKETEEAHKANQIIYYRVVTGMKPLLEDIAELGFDCIEGFEPELSNCSNEDIKSKLYKKAVIWTGVSSPVHIGAADDTSVRRAVGEAMETFDSGGFILGVTNSIRGHWPWENTLAMVDEWKKMTGRTR